MSAATILLAPSVRLRSGISEGLGLAPLEAQATGLPVIAYATGGLVEVVPSGSGGIAVPAGDTEALAAAVVELLANDETWLHLAVAGPKFVARAFDASANARILADRLLQLVQAPGHESP